MILHSIIGKILLCFVVFMILSSVIYVIIGSDAWFSRMAVGVITLGLWYTGTRVNPSKT